MGESLNEETLERLIRSMSERLEYQSPYEHLYDWLQAKDPMLFAQWQAIYDITKGV